MAFISHGDFFLPKTKLEKWFNIVSNNSYILRQSNPN